MERAAAKCLPPLLAVLTQLRTENRSALFLELR